MNWAVLRARHSTGASLIQEVNIEIQITDSFRTKRMDPLIDSLQIAIAYPRLILLTAVAGSSFGVGFRVCLLMI